MLTGDLVQARGVKGGGLKIRFLDPSDLGVKEDADWLCRVAQHGLAKKVTRGTLEDGVASEAQIRPDHKQVKGLAKILFDAATFDTRSTLTPKELREKVFTRAAERGPLALEPNPFGTPTADDVLAELAAELGTTAEELREGLYADRKQEQRLVELGITEPDALIDRYNVGLVQAVLLRATRVQVTLPDPPAARVRQLFRYVKFHQLMHRVHRDDAGLHLIVDGPESVLKQSTRYGLKLATFFPALLLHDRWQLEAEVVWKNKNRTLSLDQGCGLNSHYTDRGGYTPRVCKRFADRFAEVDTPWKLVEGEEPLSLGEHVVMPDFTLKRGRKKVHLEILGFWRKDYLQRRLEALGRYKKANLLLAVSKRLVADASGLDDVPVIPFAEIVPVGKVLEAADAL